MDRNSNYTDQLRAVSGYRRIRLVLSYVPALAGLAAVLVVVGAGLGAILLGLMFSGTETWIGTLAGGFVFVAGIVGAFAVYFAIQLAGEALTLLVDVADGLNLLNSRAGLPPSPASTDAPIARPGSES